MALVLCRARSDEMLDAKLTKHKAAPLKLIQNNAPVWVATIKHNTANAKIIMQMKIISSILSSDTCYSIPQSAAR